MPDALTPSIPAADAPPAGPCQAAPRLANVDLHCHSSVSDGLLAPAALVRAAADAGVTMLALTDHDDVAGLAAARAEATALGIAFVSGVEISVSWHGETVHVVGLGVDAAHPGLLAGLAAVRSGRTERAQRMAAELARAGIPDAFAGAARYAENASIIGRTHFARYLVERGVAREVKDVFDRFLAKGKVGYVPHQWAVLADAVGWIRDAGGYAVLAHPGRYRIKPGKLQRLLADFCTVGGQGIEVVSGSQAPEETLRMSLLAEQYGLLASRGSDFHGPGESHLGLGQIPPLPASVTPIWTLF